MPQTKTDFVRFRVDRRQRQLLERAADNQGANLSEFARTAALNAATIATLESDNRRSEPRGSDQ